MAEVSAGLVNTGQEGQRLGDNTGGAVVLDRAPETAIPDVQGRAEVLAKQFLVQESQKRLRDEQQRRADEKLFLDLNNDLKIEYARGAYGDKAVERLNTQANELAKMKASGASIGDIAKKQAEMQRENDVIGRDAQNVFKSFDSWVGLEKPIMDNPSKYDTKYYDAQMRKINSMLEEGKDLREVDRYMTDPKNYPLRRDVDTKTIMANATPDYVKDGRLSYIDPETARNNLTLHFGTDDGMEEMDALVSQGTWGNNPEEVINKMTETIVANKPSKRDPTPKSETGGGKTSTGYIVSTDFKDDPTNLDTNVEQNVMSVKSSTGGDMKPIQVEANGKLILFQPSQFVMGKNGKIGVQGFEVKEEVSGEPEMVMGEDGQVVMVEKPKTIQRLNQIWTDYDSNKAQFKSALGFDAYDRLNKKKSGSEKPNNSNNENKTDAKVITTKEEFDALPKGAVYKKADGKTYKKG